MFSSALTILINVFYWALFFGSGGAIEYIILCLIASMLLYLLSRITTPENYDRWIIKYKFFAFITLTVGNITLTNLQELSRIDSPAVLSILSIFVFINILATFYCFVLMLIFSITEVKEIILK